MITEATPEGPARLLRAARDMFALGFYSYELVACSNAWSIFAVEAALKLRLGADEKTPFRTLVMQARGQDLINDHLADILHRAGASEPLCSPRRAASLELRDGC